MEAYDYTVQQKLAAELASRASGTGSSTATVLARRKRDAPNVEMVPDDFPYINTTISTARFGPHFSGEVFVRVKRAPATDGDGWPEEESTTPTPATQGTTTDFAVNCPDVTYTSTENSSVVYQIRNCSDAAKVAVPCECAQAS